MMKPTIPSEDTHIAKRRMIYSAVANELALLSNKHLLELIKNATPMGVSIGGASALLKINGANIFVKKVRLTDIEQRFENVMSTANYFQLPLYYQYGVGSTGFGTWRELATHIMTTNWVLAEDCSNFPMLYHWRILPMTTEEPTSDELKKLEKDVAYWNNSPAIRSRLEANLKASKEVILFLEYFPENLYQWLGKQLADGDVAAESACRMIDNNLRTTTAFINSRGLLHFDAHFHNILTDGELLYFSDFGLAMSSHFDLSEAEAEFLKHHLYYDLYSTATNFLHCLITHYFGEDKWIESLQEYLTGSRGALPPFISQIIRNYAQIALLMDRFYRTLQKDKKTLYPGNA